MGVNRELYFVVDCFAAMSQIGWINKRNLMMMRLRQFCLGASEMSLGAIMIVAWSTNKELLVLLLLTDE